MVFVIGYSGERGGWTTASGDPKREDGLVQMETPLRFFGGVREGG